MHAKGGIIVKKNITRILSFILVCVIAVGILPAMAPVSVGAEGAVGTTDLFNGHATYLLQERFNGAMTNTFGKDSEGNNLTNVTLSGWDVDSRGGRVYKSGDNLMLLDSNGFESTTLSHKLMKHTGDGLVLETSFKYSTYVTNGFSYEISGDDKISLRLVVDGGYICIENADGTKTKLTNCKADTVYHIKAEFSNSKKKVNIWINGQSKGQYDYLEKATSIDEVKIGTGKDQMAEIVLGFVYVYVNYIVNETFMAAPTGNAPVWMTATGGTIAAMPGAPYPADPNGFSLPKQKELVIEHEPVNVMYDDEMYSFIWDMFIPSGGADGFDFTNGVEFNIRAGKMYVEGSPVYTYTKNVWYKIELKVSLETIDVYVNNVKRATVDNYIEEFSELRFKNNASSNVLLDNIFVHKSFVASDFEDYPTVGETPESDINVGMIVYPMWREGIHYGWDLITPYEERTPYLGYYTGGSREVADWDNKWLLEHGFDHAIFPFARPDITAAGGQPSFSVRGEALHDGYLNSEYKDQLDFAIMLTNPLDESYDSAEDFIANVEPYLVEHYFKNPSYKVIDNKLLVYCYNPKGFGTYMGGIDKFATVLESLNTAVKKIDNGNGGTYDGIIFVADISSGDGLESFNSLTSSCSFDIYKWRYTWGSDKYANIVNGIKNDYANDNATVASIPMGFDNTPWKYNEVGIIDPAGVQAMCDAVVDYKTSSDPNIVVLTCWDEWGEGHFFAPSNIHGFDYLNVVRDTFTSSGEKTDEDRPTEDAVRRMDVLYPEGRQILKIKKDKVATSSDDLSKLTSLGKISVKNTKGSTGGCEYTGSGNWLTGYKSCKYTITGSPATVSYTSGISNSKIDASKITAVRIRGYAQNSSTMVLYLTTNQQGEFDAGDKKIRLEGRTDGTTNITDTILYPEDPENFIGTVNGIRFNPAANTSNGSVIYLEEIEFYTGSLGTTVTLDDEEIELVSPVEFAADGYPYLPAYKLLLDLGAYVTWDKQAKTMTAEKGGVTVKVIADNSKWTVNGDEKTFSLTPVSHIPYYKEGNLFIPYKEVLAEFGYTVTRNNNTIAIQSKHYNDLKNYVNTNTWDFNIDNYTEEWKSSGVLKPVTVSNGMMHLYSKSSDPIVTIEGLNIPKEKAKYAILRIKKTDRAENGMLRLFDENTNASGVVYSFRLEPSEDVQEFVFDLASDATVNSTYTNKFADLTKITKLRLDPMDNYGSILIDKISITDTLPETGIKMNAYGFEKTNMLQLDAEKTGFAYTNALNSAGTTASGILPATETVDGYENVIKVIPTSGNNSGLFTLEDVYYEGSKQKIEELCKDGKIVKVGFWYKGIGNCTALRFESRQGGARDGEEFEIKDISNSEWKYFEGYMDMSNETASNRWFTMRVTTGGNTAKDGVYLRDYQFVCLDEETPVTTADETIAIMVVDHDNVVDDNAKVFVSEYDVNGKIVSTTTNTYPNTVTVLSNGKTVTETARYYILNPKEGTTKVKCFLWNDDLSPLVQGLTLNKK